MKENIALFDSSHEEAAEFIRGLKDETGEEWRAIVCNSNKGRRGIRNALRYIKYFVFPFLIFCRRKKYKSIIGWQEFYGLIYAFYCRLFKVKKCNFLIIKNFIYKPKKGVIGKLYFWFMNYIVKSEYVDIYICASTTMREYCCEEFRVNAEKFVYLPFGVEDFSLQVDKSCPPQNDYVLSIGRSNRDWQFLQDTFKEFSYNLKIICDELKTTPLSSNVEILNNVWGKGSYDYIYNCKCMIIPIDNPKIASGDTVLLQAMSFSKPIIITKPSCLADDYVEHMVNGIVINKDKDELKKALDTIFLEKEISSALATNGRKRYEENHSLYTYGKRVGQLAGERVC